jgi:hypothetical protein
MTTNNHMLMLLEWTQKETMPVGQFQTACHALMGPAVQYDIHPPNLKQT